MKRISHRLILSESGAKREEGREKVKVKEKVKVEGGGGSVWGQRQWIHIHGVITAL
jgi:hypothetical protein